jgi:hypothetical protein
MRAVDRSYRGTRAVGEGSCRRDVRVEVPVALEDVELVQGGLLRVVAGVGPGAGRFVGVGARGREGALGDAEVEVAEDELDAEVRLVGWFGGEGRGEGLTLGGGGLRRGG